jgi:hypothetical protein
MKDQLFLLRPGFFNGGLGPLYCGDSVAVEGLLSFCPTLRELVDVHYIEFQRPRAPLVEALGEAYQAAPVIILAGGRELMDEGVDTQEANGHRFICHERTIRRYLSTQYDLPIAG